MKAGATAQQTANRRRSCWMAILIPFHQAIETRPSVSRWRCSLLFAPVTISGLVLMPRQNHREHEGDIRERGW